MTGALRLARILYAYVQSRYFRVREVKTLQRRQLAALTRHFDWLALQSAYWQDRVGSSSTPPLERLKGMSIVDKKTWLADFDEANTVGLTLAAAQDVALRAERDRDFSPTLNGVTVGLSSGTSGSRGVFVVSAKEQATWAGTVLGRLLPQGLLAGARVAFFLRASSNLYTSVTSKRVAFEFFDLLEDFEAHTARLSAFAPTVIVAPAQVLKALAEHPLASQWRHSRVVSVAEVLEPAVRAQLEQHFDDVQEVYQATEGLLAMSCEHGRLHLNEHVFVEKEYLDDTRFVPVITDLARRAQPLVRYRLNDVLRESTERCPCGRAALVIDAVEGRCDDQLTFARKLDGRPVTVFADAVSRVLAQVLPATADYELLQTSSLTLTLKGTCPLSSLVSAGAELGNLFSRYGIDSSGLSWTFESGTQFEWQPHVKRRRIRRISEVGVPA